MCNLPFSVGSIQWHMYIILRCNDSWPILYALYQPDGRKFSCCWNWDENKSSSSHLRTRRSPPVAILIRKLLLLIHVAKHCHWYSFHTSMRNQKIRRVYRSESRGLSNECYRPVQASQKYSLRSSIGLSSSIAMTVAAQCVSNTLSTNFRYNATRRWMEWHQKYGYSRLNCVTTCPGTRNMMRGTNYNRRLAYFRFLRRHIRFW